MIEMIWCQDTEGAIGFEGNLLFSIPEDMEIFKAVTKGKPLIMGRKTFDALPRKSGKSPLPDRYKYVMSRLHINESPYMDVEYICFKDMLAQTKRHTAKPYVVIGGGEIYREFLPYADILHITGVMAKSDQADTYAPQGDFSEFNKNSSMMIRATNGLVFEYAVWIRKQKETTTP